MGQVSWILAGTAVGWVIGGVMIVCPFKGAKFSSTWHLWVLRKGWLPIVRSWCVYFIADIVTRTYVLVKDLNIGVF